MRSLANMATYFSAHPMTRDSQVQAWVRFVMWQIKCRFQQEVVFDWIADQKLYARKGMTGVTGNIYCGLHEFTDMAFLLHMLRSDDLFFDVGANIGSYTILASGVCGARTWAFEPDPDTARQLQRNVDLNELGQQVKVVVSGVSDQEGQLRFTKGLDTINRVVDAGHTDTQVLSVTTLDKMAEPACPLLMKIDIEGHEPQAMRGAEATLRDERLQSIIIETVTPEVEGALTSAGFQLRYYDPFNRSLSETRNALPTNNRIFVRDHEFVAKRLETASSVDVLGRPI